MAPLASSSSSSCSRVGFPFAPRRFGFLLLLAAAVLLLPPLLFCCSLTLNTNKNSKKFAPWSAFGEEASPRRWCRDERRKFSASIKSNRKTVGSDNRRIPPLDAASNGGEEQRDASRQDTSRQDASRQEQRDASPVLAHYVFLVHGWNGNDLEMGYMETALRNQVAEARDRDSTNRKETSPRIVIHKSTCNNKKTHDGIANGGRRLANEIQQFIQRDLLQKDMSSLLVESNSPAVVAISLIGNSLGGLYARFALSRLNQTLSLSLPSSVSSSSSSAQIVHLTFHLFCTTATPHLGVASHTYISAPRFVEVLIGWGSLDRTLRDMLRFPLSEEEEEDKVATTTRTGTRTRASETGGTSRDDLVYRMATHPEYLQPLRQFRHRITYANAFGTDFQVPTATAAFLSRKSTYPHIWKKRDKDAASFVAVIVETTTPKEEEECPEAAQDDIVEMSQSLDKLGWTKVFVDLRPLLPLPSLRLPFRPEGVRQALQQWYDNQCGVGGKDSDDVVTVESRDLAEWLDKTEDLAVPVGHTVLVANSKSPWIASFNAGGRPVVDHLAADFVSRLLEEKET